MSRRNMPVLVQQVKSDGGGSGAEAPRSVDARRTGERPAPSVRLGHASATPRVYARAQRHACRPRGGEARTAQVKGR